MKKHRKEKLNEQFKRILSELIMREVKDPRIKGFITVTEVDIAPDMKNAKVYVSIFGLTEKDKEKCFKGLESSTNFLKYLLSKQLSLRYTPDLRFHMDDTLDRGFNIIEKLENIKAKETKTDDQ